MWRTSAQPRARGLSSAISADLDAAWAQFNQVAHLYLAYQIHRAELRDAESAGYL
jgi:hypothetical protein